MGQFVLLLMYSVNQLDLIWLLPLSHLLAAESCLLPLLLSNHPHVFITFIPPASFSPSSFSDPFFFEGCVFSLHPVSSPFSPSSLLLQVCVWLEKVDLSKWHTDSQLPSHSSSPLPPFLIVLTSPLGSYLLFLALAFLPLLSRSDLYLYLHLSITSSRFSPLFLCPSGGLMSVLFEHR